VTESLENQTSERYDLGEVVNLELQYLDQAPPMTTFKTKLQDKLLSGANLLWIYLSGDEVRADMALMALAEQLTNTSELPIEFEQWNQNTGATWHNDPALRDPLLALASLTNEDAISHNAFICMRDLHLLLNAQNNFSLRRMVIDNCKRNNFNNENHRRPLVIMADTPTPHPDIKDYCDVLDFSLPDFRELREYTVDFVLNGAPHIAEKISDTDRDRITYALLGMSAEEATRVFSYALRVVNHEVDDFADNAGKQSPGILSIAADQKAMAVRKIEGLTFIPHKDIPSMEHFGGFDHYLDFIRKRSRGYTSAAKHVGMRKPRGVVLLGPPGTGKTQVAMATAGELKRDLIQMDIGSLFDSLVGSSEKKVRAAINMIDAMKSCVLMVDEIDKAFAGATSANDSGVSSRILSYFLSWLSNRSLSSESDSQIFVIVTMNRTNGIPPELLRMGRFDRIFSTDLPEADDRVNILKIHMQKNNIDSAQYGSSVQDIARITDKWAGGELEELVISALYESFNRIYIEWEAAGSDPHTMPTIEACQPTIDDYLEVSKTMVPLAVTEAEAIEEMRKFCEGRTTPVTGKRTHDAKGTRKNRGIQARKKSGLN